MIEDYLFGYVAGIITAIGIFSFVIIHKLNIAPYKLFTKRRFQITENIGNGT